MPPRLVYWGMFHIVITGRKAPVVIRDPETRKMKLVDDTSPQVVQYRDYRHALADAKKLKPISQQNPTASVELRPANLKAADDGEKMPLADWIKLAVATPLPSVQQRVEPAVPPRGTAEVDALLAAREAVSEVATHE